MLLLVLPPLSDAAERDRDGGSNDEAIVFVPRPDARPGHRIEGAVRGPAAGAPTLTIIAPQNKTGQTSRERPSVYWYLSRKCDKEIVVVLQSAGADATRAEVRLPGPHEAGFHKLDWAASGGAAAPRASRALPQLDVGQYTLTITVRITDDEDADQSGNPTTSAPIQRVDEPAVKALKDVREPSVRAKVYGTSGLWFDMIDELNTAIDQRNGRHDELVLRRMELLRNQGLRFKANGDVVAVPVEDGDRDAAARRR
jgi:hypothetical protein